MNQCLGINGAFVEQVACNDDEIYRAPERLVNNIPEGATKIVEAFAHAILLITKVRIRDMDKRSSHRLSPLYNVPGYKIYGQVGGPVIQARKPAAKITIAARLKISTSRRGFLPSVA